MADKTSRAWGEIRTVSAAEVRGSRSAWAELFTEIRLRLEKTPEGECLEIPFEDNGLRDSARGAMTSFFRRANGNGFVETRCIGQFLYVRRGPAYGKLTGTHVGRRRGDSGQGKYWRSNEHPEGENEEPEE